MENDVEQNNYDSENLHLGYVTGVISRARMQTFERVLWRSLRGNLYMKSAEIDEPIVDPDTDSVVDKNVFCIFAHGTEIIAKIKKISESLGGTLYTIDDSADKRRDSLLEVTSRIEDLNNVRTPCYVKLLSWPDSLYIFVGFIHHKSNPSFRTAQGLWECHCLDNHCS